MSTTPNEGQVLYVTRYRAGAHWGVLVVSFHNGKPHSDVLEGLSYSEACDMVRRFRVPGKAA